MGGLDSHPGIYSEIEFYEVDFFLTNEVQPPLATLRLKSRSNQQGGGSCREKT